ncbi:hypothetical protein LCGC14_2287790 [marine sediment metagenome]|uniref:Uncharacterized protein n=1 Tax=marine sediment metagenome TaxID=412755 RepID=A0A0F9FMB6_9ZZZZ
MKQKKEKQEYGRAVACRLEINDYDYFVGIAKARGLRRSELLKQLILNFLNDLKEVEKEYEFVREGGQS